MRRALFSSFLFPVVLFAILAACSRVLADAEQPIVFNQYAGVGPIGVMTVFVLMCAICLPTLAVAIWLQRLSLAGAAALGVVAGFLGFNAPNFERLLDSKLHLQFRLQEAFTAYPFAVAGALAATVVWLLTVWKNPAFAQRSGQAPHRANTKSAA
jgi:hypothetical protein